MQRPLRWRVLIDHDDGLGCLEWSECGGSELSEGEAGVECLGGQFTKGVEDRVEPFSELGRHWRALSKGMR